MGAVRDTCTRQSSSAESAGRAEIIRASNNVPLVTLRDRAERLPRLSWFDLDCARWNDLPFTRRCLTPGTIIARQMTQPSSSAFMLVTGLTNHFSSGAVMCRGMPFRPCHSRVDLLPHPDLCCPQARTTIAPVPASGPGRPAQQLEDELPRLPSACRPGRLLLTPRRNGNDIP